MKKTIFERHDMKTLRDDVLAFAKKEYGTDPEHLWHSYPNYEVLRHTENNKWYAVIMDVRRESLGIGYDGFVDILDVKVDPMMGSLLRGKKGYLPGYHMNKENWISVLLDGTVRKEKIFDLLDQSFVLTADKKVQAARRAPKNWIVPANPKYFDLIAAFKENDIIEWKQSSDIHVGDLVYLYYGAPYSALLYKSEAVEVNIPYDYRSKHVTVKRAMRIRKLEEYDPSYMPFARLKEEFDVRAVRGPRSMPARLKEELDRYEKGGNE